MKIMIYVMMMFVVVGMVSASLWLTDFNDSPTSIEGTDCLVEGERVCGYDTGESPALQCSDPSEIIVPVANATTYSSNFISSYVGGGYIINAEDYDAGDPYCDNGGVFWCERNESCYGSSAYRNTVCIGSGSGGTFATSTCGTCQTGVRWDCFGGTDCEATSTSDCQAGTIPHTRYDTGTCNTGLEGGASGTCQCDAGYLACDGGIEDGDGCEVQAGVTACGGGANNNLDDCTTCVCDSGFLDCDGLGANVTDGCEIEVGGSCGVGTGTYAAACAAGDGNCIGTGNNIDCDDDDGDDTLTTCNGANGCEVEDGGSCSVGVLSGTYNQCSCEVDATDVWTQKWHNDSTASWMMVFSQYSVTGGFLKYNSSDESTNFSIDSKGNVNTTGFVCDGDKNCLHNVSGGVDTNESVRMNEIYSWVFLNHSFWDLAYSWGDHALAGYLTSYLEYDPVYSNVSGEIYSNITSNPYGYWNDTSNGDTDTNVSGGGVITGLLNITYSEIYMPNISYDRMNSTHYACAYTNGSGWRVERRPCDL